MKIKKKNPTIICMLIVIMCISLFSGCGIKVDKIVISGDPEVADIIEKLAYQYRKETGVIIDVNATGASLGFHDVVQGISDIGLLGRNLQKDEGAFVKTGGFICSEGIVFIANKDFNEESLPSQGFTLEKAAMLFWQEADNWYDVFGSAMGNTEDMDSYLKSVPIVPINRSQTNGLREAFDQESGIKDSPYLVASGKKWPNYESSKTVFAGSEGEAISLVKSTPGAVAYVRYSTYLSHKDDVTLIGIKDPKIPLSHKVYPDEITISTGKYILARKFRYIINNEHVSDSAIEFVKWLNSPKAENVFTHNGLVANVIQGEGK